MKSAIISRLLTVVLMCLAAGYIVVANTTPASSVAANRPDYASSIVLTPLASVQQPLPTVEINPAPPIALATAAPARTNQLNAKVDRHVPLGPHDDILAILAKPEIEVTRPRSPFLEALPRFDDDSSEIKPVQKASVRDSRDSSQTKKAKRVKGRRNRTTNPFAQLWQPKFRKFNSDNPFRDSNNGIFGPRSSTRRSANTSY